MLLKNTTDKETINFSDFTFVQLLGKGTYGEVWEVTDPSGR